LCVQPHEVAIKLFRAAVSKRAKGVPYSALALAAWG